MDLYHIYCNLKPGVSDVDWADAVHRYFAHLKAEGLIEGWRVTRRKLGLGPSHLTEFHMWLETRDLDQLDRAFRHVAGRGEPVESLHHAVNSRVTDTTFALYRDFPDPVRKRGEEKF